MKMRTGIILFFLTLFFGANASASVVTARITDFDPPPGQALAFYDKFYMQIDYQSDQPIRFRAVPKLKGRVLEYGAIEKTPILNVSGSGVALAWVTFSNTTRIDEVRIDVLDSQWQKIDELGIEVEAIWNAPMRDQKRPVPDWVKHLERKEKVKMEYVFDPTPQKSEVAYDVFFYFTVFTIPFFLFLQIQSLRVWRGRWRELAAIPLISIVPMVVVSMFGFGLELRLWIIFMFRGMPLAMLYLIVLWVAKRYSERTGP